MEENKQSYIVEYEIGQETFYAHVIADHLTTAIAEFSAMKIKDAMFPVYEPLGKIITDGEFQSTIKSKNV